MITRASSNLKPSFLVCGKLNINGEDVRLLFPSTYVNKSGQAVAAIVQYFKIDPFEILVAYDELDLPVGTTRLKKRRRPRRTQRHQGYYQGNRQSRFQSLAYRHRPPW